MYRYVLTSRKQLDRARQDETCIRPVDQMFLPALVKKFEKDPSAQGVPPVSVLCTYVNNQEEFSNKHKDTSWYEVLGGQHTALARREVYKKHPDDTLLQRILSEVYVGLSDDEALRLASRMDIFSTRSLTVIT